MLSDDDVWRRFGEWLSSARIARDLSRAQLAERSGVAEATIKRLETGGHRTHGMWIRVNPAETTLHKLASGLRIDNQEVCARAEKACRAPSGDATVERHAAEAYKEEIEELKRRIAELESRDHQRRGR